MELSPELLHALASQVVREQANAMSYQAIGQAARAEGFCGIAERWEHDAADELQHAGAWLAFIARYRVRVPVFNGALSPASPAPEYGAVEMAVMATNLERDTEEAMREVLRVAEASGDGAAAAWIGERLVEQQEETKRAEDFAGRVERAAVALGCLTLLDMALEMESEK